MSCTCPQSDCHSEPRYTAWNLTQSQILMGISWVFSLVFLSFWLYERNRIRGPQSARKTYYLDRLGKDSYLWPSIVKKIQQEQGGTGPSTLTQKEMELLAQHHLKTAGLLESSSSDIPLQYEKETNSLSSGEPDHPYTSNAPDHPYTANAPGAPNQPAPRQSPAAQRVTTPGAHPRPEPGLPQRHHPNPRQHHQPGQYHPSGRQDVAPRDSMGALPQQPTMQVLDYSIHLQDYNSECTLPGTHDSDRSHRSDQQHLMTTSGTIVVPHRDSLLASNKAFDNSIALPPAINQRHLLRRESSEDLVIPSMAMIPRNSGTIVIPHRDSALFTSAAVKRAAADMTSPAPSRISRALLSGHHHLHLHGVGPPASANPPAAPPKLRLSELPHDIRTNRLHRRTSSRLPAQNGGVVSPIPEEPRPPARRDGQDSPITWRKMADEARNTPVADHAEPLEDPPGWGNTLPVEPNWTLETAASAEFGRQASTGGIRAVQGPDLYSPDPAQLPAAHPKPNEPPASADDLQFLWGLDPTMLQPGNPEMEAVMAHAVAVDQTAPGQPAGNQPTPGKHDEGKHSPRDEPCSLRGSSSETSSRADSTNDFLRHMSDTLVGRRQSSLRTTEISKFGKEIESEMGAHQGTGGKEHPTAPVVHKRSSNPSESKLSRGSLTDLKPPTPAETAGFPRSRISLFSLRSPDGGIPLGAKWKPQYVGHYHNRTMSDASAILAHVEYDPESIHAKPRSNTLPNHVPSNSARSWEGKPDSDSPVVREYLRPNAFPLSPEQAVHKAVPLTLVETNVGGRRASIPVVSGSVYSSQGSRPHSLHYGSESGCKQTSLSPEGYSANDLSNGGPGEVKAPKKLMLSSSMLFEKEQLEEFRDQAERSTIPLNFLIEEPSPREDLPEPPRVALINSKVLHNNRQDSVSYSFSTEYPGSPMPPDQPSRLRGPGDASFSPPRTRPHRRDSAQLPRPVPTAVSHHLDPPPPGVWFSGDKQQKSVGVHKHKASRGPTVIIPQYPHDPNHSRRSTGNFLTPPISAHSRRSTGDYSYHVAATTKTTPSGARHRRGRDANPSRSDYDHDSSDLVEAQDLELRLSRNESGKHESMSRSNSCDLANRVSGSHREKPARKLSLSRNSESNDEMFF